MAAAQPSRLGNLRLNLANSRLNLQKLLDLLEGLPCERIDELNASHNDLGDHASRALLRQLPELRTLRLSSAGLSSEGVKATIEALTDRWLSLPAAKDNGEVDPSRVSVASASSGSAYAQQSSSPSKTPVPAWPPQATGTNRALRSSRGLQVLELAASSVDAAVPELGLYLASQCCTLTELDLSWNTLGPNAVHQLSWHLRQNVTLRTLRLAHCHLKEAAGVLCACLATTGSHLPLQRLDLARNAMPTAAFEELAIFLGSVVGRQIMDLDISGNGAVSDEACSRALGSALQPPDNLESELSCSYSGGACSEMNLKLGGTKPFFDPAYGRWDAGPQILTVLRSPHCRVLDVSLDGCAFGEAAVPSLARICLNVRRFSLCQCGGGEGSLGQSFAVHLEDLARGLGRRRKGSGTASAESSPAQVSRSTRERQRPLRLLLRELRLRDLALRDSSVQLLVNAISWLRVARRDMDDLEVLELDGNHLTQSVVQSLTPLLTELRTLQRLSLSRNKLRHLGGVALAELLMSRPPEAAALNLQLRRCALNTEGALHVWHAALSEEANVRSLDLAENVLDAAALEAMLKMSPKGRLGPYPEELILLPSACGARPVAQLVQQIAPWKSICLRSATVEAGEVAQLMNCFGDSLALGHPGRPPTAQLSENGTEFSLSLTGASLGLQPQQWSLVADAVAFTLSPPMQVPDSANVQRPLRSTGPCFRRLGGCGGSLRIELNDCDLSLACFKAPRVVDPPDPASPEMSSIARSARREVPAKVGRGERMPVKSLAVRARSATRLCEGTTKSPSASSSSAPFRTQEADARRAEGAASTPSRRMIANNPNSAKQAASPSAKAAGRSDSPGGGRSRAGRPPAPAQRVCREENFGLIFDRQHHVELEVSTVLRELRNIQGLRLVQCNLTDRWLAQLGHSGTSAKWSAVRLLDLRCNELTALSAPAIASVIAGGLQALLLDGNRLQIEGFQVLCNAMKAAGQKCALRWFSLAHNDLGHPSGSLLADLFGSAGSYSLQELSLAWNPKISGGEISTLLRALARVGPKVGRLQLLDVAGTGAGPQVLPAAMRALMRVEGLVVDLSGCKALQSFRDFSVSGSAEALEIDRCVAERRLLLPAGSVRN